MPTLRPSETPTANPTVSPTPTRTATVTRSPSPTPSATLTLPSNVSGWNLVRQPGEPARRVGGVWWSQDGGELLYALAPPASGYLLEWWSYDVNSRSSARLRSPNFSFAQAWEKAQVGYPRAVDPFSELLGYVSPEGTKLIYPNAGFSGVFTNPNYIYVIYPDGQSRQRILGPTYRGTVERAVWIDFETRVLFDYHYQDRAVIYLADLVSGRTKTLVELTNNQSEWSVSPDEEYLLVPQDGRSQLLPLKEKQALSLLTPGGMARPTWSADSTIIYFWAGDENRILSFDLADQMVRPFIVRRDLEPFSPISPVYGMPFTVSPNGNSIAFWQENWIWIVALK